MLDRYIEDEVMPLCSKEGIGLAVFSPLAQGVLTGKYKKGQEIPKDSRAADKSAGKSISRYLNDDILTKVEKLEAIASDHGMALSQLALAWILTHPEISSVIIGASKPEQIEENVKAAGKILDESTMEEIKKILNE